MIFNVIKYLILISTLQSQVIAASATIVTIPGIVTPLSTTPYPSSSSLSPTTSSLTTLVVGNINQIPGRNAHQLTAIPATQATLPTIVTSTTGGQYYLLHNEAVAAPAAAADNTIVGSRPLIIKPYNIFDSVVLCPIGYILANNHCHKQVKYATRLYAYI